jgi:hypothetical protein
VFEFVGDAAPDELLCEVEAVGELLAEELVVEAAKLYPSTGIAIRVAEPVKVVEAAAKEFDAGDAYVKLWPDVMADALYAD